MSSAHGIASRQATQRRTFLVRMTGMAFGAATSTLLPVSLLEASEACALPGVIRLSDPCGDWTLDDMCTAYPPYTFDIRRGVAPDDAPAARIAAVDAMWGV